MRRCPTLLVIRKMQINITIRYHYILLRIAKKKKREREKQHHCWLGENVEKLGLSTGKHFFKVKDPFAIQPNNPTPRYLSKRNENLCSHKNLNTDIYSSCIYNIKKLGIIQMFFSSWLNKVWYIDTMEPHSTRQGWTTDASTISESLRTVLRERSQVQRLHAEWVLFWVILEKDKP